VLPRFSVDLGLDPCSLSRDPEVQEAYRSDPMVTSRVTLRWAAETLDAVRRVTEGMAGIAIPLLVLHGEADPLNLAEGARRLSAAVPPGGTTLRVYQGVFHEPHNDTGHEQVVADVLEWLARVTDARDVRHGA
jgi:alpha-beta hydrolase superfamily lysophospholipase